MNEPNTQLAVPPPAPVAQVDRPMSVIEVIGQVQLIQDVMKAVMQNGEHYGVIPGCGKKPTLLKAGAEKLCLTFRLAPRYEVTEEREGDHYRATVRCILTHVNSGRTMGEGLGNCSTKESKYGLRWVDGKQVPNDKLSDQHNTVLKMACKRGLVAATLNATAASDIFTQDIEDMDRGAVQDQRPPIQPPQQKAPAAPSPQTQAAPPAQANGDKLTDPQRKLIFARWKASGIPEADFRAFLLAAHGSDSTDAIPKKAVDVVLAWLDENRQG